MKITRRKLAAAALASAGLGVAHAQAPPPPAQPEDLNAAAKEQARKNTEALAKFDVPVSTEPAFQFRA